MCSLICSQWVRLGCGPGSCVCCRDPAAVFPSCPCGLAALVSGKVFWLVMGSDGFQTQKNKSWVSGQVRAERVLAEAITIDGRKEWTCKFCSESNVWRRWRCRRCYHNIRAVLCGKHRQAVAAKSGEWSPGSLVERRREKLKAWKPRIKSFRARIDAMGKKEGAQKGSGISFIEEVDLE